MPLLTALAGKLFGAAAGGVADYAGEARRDRRLEELGWNRNDLERLRAERKLARRAREIEDETPVDLDDALGELGGGVQHPAKSDD